MYKSTILLTKNHVPSNTNEPICSEIKKKKKFWLITLVLNWNILVIILDIVFITAIVEEHNSVLPKMRLLLLSPAPWPWALLWEPGLKMRGSFGSYHHQKTTLWWKTWKLTATGSVLHTPLISPTSFPSRNGNEPFAIWLLLHFTVR